MRRPGPVVGLALVAFAAYVTVTGWRNHDFEGGIRVAMGVTFLGNFVSRFLQAAVTDWKKHSLRRRGRWM